MNLTENVTNLKMFQDNLTTLETDLKRSKEIFELENKVLIDKIKEVKQIVDNTKKSIETDVLEKFKNDPSIKKFYGGVGIQERNTLTYDSDKALQFAKEKDMFLALDKKSFEKVADSLGLDFVKKDTKTIATFPKEIKLEG